MAIEIALLGAERHADFTAPLRTSFGLRFDAERAGRMQRLEEVTHRIAAMEGDAIVGSAGGFRFTMTTPGGTVPMCGLTMVGVLPTHRRRGILTSMMRRHLEEAHENGMPVSALWASEGQIYGRFGYGVASLACSVALPRLRAQFKRPLPQRGTFRLVTESEARATFPGVWDRIRLSTPGMLARSLPWWEARKLGDYEPSLAPLERVLMEVDGKPEGYALYRFSGKLSPPGPIELDLHVLEAMAVSPSATWQLWRYLCDMDLAARIQGMLLPRSHPIFHMVLEPRRLQMTVEDGLWLRLVDADAALDARAWPVHESLTFALYDELCSWNSGVYRIADGRVTRAHGSPDLKLDAAALGSLYLGGISARQLADAGDVDELTPGAIERADALFRSSREPWCPEIF